MPAMWVLAAALGYWVTQSSAIVVTSIAVAVLLVLAAVFRPGQLLAVAAVLIPFRVVEVLLPISRGGITTADGFLIAFMISALLRPRPIPRRHVPTVAVVAVLILVAVGLASMIHGGFYGVGIRKVGRIVVIATTFIAAARSVTYKDARIAASALVISSGLSAIVALGFTARAANAPGVVVLRLWGGVEDPNHMSVVLAAAFLIALAWRPGGMPVWVWLWSSLLMLVGQVASLSRGGGLALVVGMVVLVGLTMYARSRGRPMGLWSRTGALLILLATTGALAVAFVPPELTSSAVVRYQGILNPTSDATGAFRIRLWEAGARMLAASPLLGVGPGAFGLALVATGAFSLPWEAHSSIVEIAVETGYLGAAAVVGCLLVGGALAGKAVLSAVSDTAVSDERVALSAGLLAAGAAVIMGGASLSNILYQPLFALIVILIIGTLGRQGDEVAS
ncbi:MAG: hypothetical protein HGB10_00195 [Coriobacteriia bacterium]|nr:hypothetical protein [Coriobacteriia bacterium]